MNVMEINIIRRLIIRKHHKRLAKLRKKIFLKRTAREKQNGGKHSLIGFDVSLLEFLYET